MLISGGWFLCDDGILRPVLHGEVLNGDAAWVKESFLVDTGADRTVLSAALLNELGLPPAVPDVGLGGVGGPAESVLVDSALRFLHDEGIKVIFRGRFAAVTEVRSLDMSVLGRDITNLFAVITDRPRDAVYLLGQRHYYTIHRS